jgi:iron(III) transport system permease protein
MLWRQKGRAWPSVWLVGAALVPVALTLLPLVYVVVRAWQAGAAGIWAELFRERTLSLLANTLILATSVTVAAGLTGVAVAWCVERSDLAGRRWWRAVAALPLAVPAFVSSYAWSSIDVAFQSMAGAILVLALSNYPLVYLPVAAALRRVDSSFEDVSRSLGLGPWRTFFRAVLPQLAPALGGGALLVLGHMLAEFGALSMLRVQTFTTAIFESYELQFDSTSAALQSAVLMLLCLPPAYIEMRLRAGRRVARVGRGMARTAPAFALGRVRLWAEAGFCLLALLGLGVPIATLAYWLAKGHSAGGGYAQLGPALAGTIRLSVSGALLTGILAIPLVLLATRYRGRLSMWADRLPYIVHGLPGVVVALALVFLAIRLTPTLYQGSALLLCAYAVLFLPLAQSSLRASVELVSPHIEPIARSLGRRAWYAFATVTLPNIAPGIGAALALLMLEIVRELTATLMLAPTGTITLATEIWSYTADAEYAAAAPFAALLIAISIIPGYVFTQRMLRYGETP